MKKNYLNEVLPVKPQKIKNLLLKQNTLEDAFTQYPQITKENLSDSHKIKKLNEFFRNEIKNPPYKFIPKNLNFHSSIKQDFEQKFFEKKLYSKTKLSVDLNRLNYLSKSKEYFKKTGSQPHFSQKNSTFFSNVNSESFYNTKDDICKTKKQFECKLKEENNTTTESIRNEFLLKLPEFSFSDNTKQRINLKQISKNIKFNNLAEISTDSEKLESNSIVNNAISIKINHLIRNKNKIDNRKNNNIIKIEKYGLFIKSIKNLENRKSVFQFKPINFGINSKKNDKFNIINNLKKIEEKRNILINDIMEKAEQFKKEISIENTKQKQENSFDDEDEY